MEYVINSRVAKDFLRWVNKTDTPDETYFATLIHNPQLGIPGSFKGRNIHQILYLSTHDLIGIKSS